MATPSTSSAGEPATVNVTGWVVPAAVVAVRTSDCTAVSAVLPFIPEGRCTGPERSIVTEPPSSVAVAVTPRALNGFW